MDTSLRLRHAFGANTLVSNNLHFLDGDCVTFTAGLNIIIQNVSERTQKIISLNGVNNNAITALAVTPDKKRGVVAISSSSTVLAVVDFNTFKRKKDLTCDEVENSDVISMEFDKMGQTLAILVGAPRWAILVWNWGKMALTSFIRLAVTGLSGLSLCPTDPTLVAIYSRSLLRYMRLTDEASRDIQTDVCYEVSCHAWTSSSNAQSIVGTVGGDVLLLSRGTLVSKLTFPCHNSPATTSSSDRIIAESMAICSSGFVIADSASYISIYKQTPDTDTFSCLRTFQLPVGPATQVTETRNPTSIQAFSTTHCFSSSSISQQENMLAVIRSNGQIVVSSLTQANSSPVPLSSYNHVPCHVSGLSFCATRPIIASCASDRTLRVWNYSTMVEECCKVFGEEPLAISLHPTGWHIAVGFVDRLRIYHIHMNDLKLFVELPVKNSRNIEFSDGGHLIAAASASIVSIYNFITAEKMCDIRGHNGKIISMLWTMRDSCIVTSGADGAVYSWMPENGRRIGEFVQKATHFNSMSLVPRDYFSDENSQGESDSEVQYGLICSGINGLMQVLTFPDLIPITEFLAFENASKMRKSVVSTMSQLTSPSASMQSTSFVLSSSCTALAKNAVITSLNTHGNSSAPGRIRLTQFPFGEVNESFDMVAVSGHVTKTALSKDQHLLSVADTAGILYLFEIGYSRSKSRGPPSRSEGFDMATGVLATKGTNLNITAIVDQGIDGQWSDGVIMSIGDLEEQVATIGDLKAKADELSVQNEYQLNLRDMNHTEQVNLMISKFAHQVDLQKSIFAVLKDEKDDLQLDHEEKLRQITIDHEDNIQKTEGEAQKQLIEEVDRYQKLVVEKGALHLKHEELITSLQVTHERYIKELQNEFDERLREEIDQSQTLDEAYKEQVQNETELVNQQEDDVDTEITRLGEKLERKLQNCKETSLKLKGEIGIMKKKCFTISKDMERSTEESKLLQDRQRDLAEQAKALEKEIHLHKKEIRSRDVIINGKEKEIFDLRRRSQELEKFKFVLDHKIRELKSQIEPKEDMIVELHDSIENMDSDLENIHKVNSSIDERIGVVRGEIEQSALSIKRQKKILTDHRIKFQRFLAKLREAASAIQDPAQLQAATRLIATEIGIHQSDGNVELTPLEAEDTVQHKILKDNVRSLKQQLQQDTDNRRYFMQGRIKENMDLVKAIKVQRGENANKKQMAQVRFGILQRVHRKRKLRDKIGLSKTVGLNPIASTARGGGDDDDDMKTNPSVEFQENLHLISMLRNKKKILEERASRSIIIPPSTGLSTNLDHGTIC